MKYLTQASPIPDINRRVSFGEINSVSRYQKCNNNNDSNNENKNINS